MKYYMLTIILSIYLTSCNSKESKLKDIDSNFEKSFKEQEDKSNKDYIDSISNIYSNFKYNVGYDGPDKWKFDTGLNKHTIYRTFEADSAITFSINVIEVKKSTIKNEKKLNIWDIYEGNEKQIDESVITLIEEQLNTKVQDFKATKAYLKNNVALRRTLNYIIRNLNYEYKNTSIQYQVLIDNLTFTFSLDVPTIFYNQRPNHYEELFNNIYFLKKGERLNELIQNQKAN